MFITSEDSLNENVMLCIILCICLPVWQQQYQKIRSYLGDIIGYLYNVSLLILMSLPISANRNNNVLDREYQCSPITFCQFHQQFNYDHLMYMTQKIGLSKQVTIITLAIKHNLCRKGTAQPHSLGQVNKVLLMQFIEPHNTRLLCKTIILL